MWPLSGSHVTSGWRARPGHASHACSAPTDPGAEAGHQHPRLLLPGRRGGGRDHHQRLVWAPGHRVPPASGPPAELPGPGGSRSRAPAVGCTHPLSTFPHRELNQQQGRGHGKAGVAPAGACGAASRCAPGRPARPRAGASAHRAGAMPPPGRLPSGPCLAASCQTFHLRSRRSAPGFLGPEEGKGGQTRWEHASCQADGCPEQAAPRTPLGPELCELGSSHHPAGPVLWWGGPAPCGGVGAGPREALGR